MSVHFKLKSEINYDSIACEGGFISVADLKKFIQKKRLGKSSDFDLLLTNSQTNEEYKDESFMIPKNTSVIISRVPIVGNRSFSHSSMPSNSSSTTVSNVPAPLIISNSEASEGVDQEDLKINALLQTSVLQTGAMGNTMGYNKFHHNNGHHHNNHHNNNHHNNNNNNGGSHHYNNNNGVNQPATTASSSGMPGSGNSNGSGPGLNNSSGIPQQPMGPSGSKPFPEKAPHPSYICHRCNQTGHFINQCPTNGDPKFDKHKMKKPSGIPITFLKPLQPSSTQTPMGPSTVLMPGGGVAVVLTNESQFNKMAKSIISNDDQSKKSIQSPTNTSTENDSITSPTSSTTITSPEDNKFILPKCTNCNKTNETSPPLYGIKANCCSKDICFDCIEKKVILNKSKSCPLCFSEFDVNLLGEPGLYKINGLPQNYLLNKKREIEQSTETETSDAKRLKSSETDSENPDPLLQLHQQQLQHQQYQQYQPKPKFNTYYQQSQPQYNKYYGTGGDPNAYYQQHQQQYPYFDPNQQYYDPNQQYYDPNQQQQQHQPHYSSGGYNKEYNKESTSSSSSSSRDYKESRDYKDSGRSSGRDYKDDKDYRHDSNSSRDYKDSTSRKSDRDSGGRDSKDRSGSGRETTRGSDRDRDSRDYKDSSSSSSRRDDRGGSRDSRETTRSSDRDRDSRDYKDSSSSRRDDKDYRSSDSKYSSSSGSRNSRDRDSRRY